MSELKLQQVQKAIQTRWEEEKMSELQPCPFCGGEADCNNSALMQGGKFMWAVECLSCGMITPGFDTEEEATAAWNSRDMGIVSDGYHTFNELYHHRAVLFACLVNSHPRYSWKSKQHHDGSMFDGMFIVGMNTPFGQVTYHYDIEPYWNLFHCRALERAPEWDGHTADQAAERLREWAEKPWGA